MKIIYQSNDGKQFDSENDCTEYEKKITSLIPKACLTNDQRKIKETIEFLNSNIEEIVTNGYPLKDFEHYCFESLICLFFDGSFWKWYNENYKG